ncbi:hypothetical protein ACQ86E_14775 [Bradyrhizobium betae]|uniref:hypothetical protein n=1 Tax=Bradyrhizobium betae TaxID=244734 RepID=UPI003D66D85F
MTDARVGNEGWFATTCDRVTARACDVVMRLEDELRVGTCLERKSSVHGVVDDRDIGARRKPGGQIVRDHRPHEAACSDAIEFIGVGDVAAVRCGFGAGDRVEVRHRVDVGFGNPAFHPSPHGRARSSLGIDDDAQNEPIPVQQSVGLVREHRMAAAVGPWWLDLDRQNLIRQRVGEGSRVLREQLREAGSPCFGRLHGNQTLPPKQLDRRSVCDEEERAKRPARAHPLAEARKCVRSGARSHDDDRRNIQPAFTIDQLERAQIIEGLEFSQRHA